MSPSPPASPGGERESVWFGESYPAARPALARKREAAASAGFMELPHAARRVRHHDIWTPVAIDVGSAVIPDAAGTGWR